MIHFASLLRQEQRFNMFYLSNIYVEAWIAQDRIWQLNQLNAHRSIFTWHNTGKYWAKSKGSTCRLIIDRTAFITSVHKWHQMALYRAMHFSAKRGIAIACRLSVRPSVCLSVTLMNCDHISWNSSKIISPLVSLGRSLFATPTWRVCSKGNTPKFSPE